TAQIEHRKEVADDWYEENGATVLFGGLPITWMPRRSQEVNSLYIEGFIPVVAPARNVPLVHQLELQASVRRDEYEVTSTGDRFGAETREGPFPDATFFTNEFASTDYLIGLRYSPVPDVTLRTSFGTGFIAPGLGQITPLISTAMLPVPVDALNPPDPLRGGTRVPVPRTQITAGNPDLQPEESETWSIGLIFMPRFLKNLRISTDYTRIRKTDEILFPNLLLIMQNEAALPGRVVRGPNLPDDPPGWAGPVTHIDASALNISGAAVDAYDFQVDYAFY